MNESEFTEGKWTIDWRSGNIKGHDGFPVAYIMGVQQGDKEARNNARLIASAPYMYRLLAYFVSGKCGKGCALRKDKVCKLFEYIDGSERDEID